MINMTVIELHIPPPTLCPKQTETTPFNTMEYLRPRWWWGTDLCSISDLMQQVFYFLIARRLEVQVQGVQDWFPLDASLLARWPHFDLVITWSSLHVKLMRMLVKLD